MAVPKKRTSSSRRNMRRSHDALKKINVVVDATTGEYKLPHHISLSDGYYNKRQVITPKAENNNENEEA
ncbi:MAG: 50S ribosomal protein L32 [Alphaproteobacteria bacterium]